MRLYKLKKKDNSVFITMKQPFSEDGIIDDEYISKCKEFCNFVVDNVKEKVNENEGLPLSMIVIYTNISDVVDIGTLIAYASRLEEVESLVRTVVVMTQ